MRDDTPSVLVERDGRVAVLTLNQPERLNALNTPMAAALVEAFAALETDATVGSVLLKGAGRGFMAGGDISEFAADRAKAPEAIDRLINTYHAAVRAMTGSRLPVIAAVHGVAAGAGVSLMAACDLVVMGEGTKLTVAYTALGTSLDGGGTWLLPRRVGMARAMEMTLLNETFTAAQALHWGLVTRVVPDPDVHKEGLALAKRLAAGPTVAYGTVKRLMNEGMTRDLSTHLDAELHGFQTCARTDDFWEGVAAFRDKRKPDFKGS